MIPIQPCELPASALLRKYQNAGSYADCYVAQVPGSHTHAAFVEAFYTTALFRLERAILRLAGRASTDAQATQLAQGSADTFAAWKVEGRSPDQLLLGDFTGRTKSWLMVAPGPGNGANAATRLYFGSAVVPRLNAVTGKKSMGFVFSALLGFHRLYSRLLLVAAIRRLGAGTAGPDKAT
ncbi:MAG: hypothetical protein ABIR26_17135 [Ramlibacter sp.]